MAYAIQVENLGKRYTRGTSAAIYSTLREALSETAARAGRVAGRALSGRDNGSRPEEFWALRDVTFEIERGRAVGLIGSNGAGKSTLLKLLSRITAPTTGRAVMRGRVGSMLEVGTGFHAELSGRENIYLNGAVLGMRRAEIGRKFDEIVAFAEVEPFIDTPVKRYSSGMYLRLAFAVAAHLEPEILIVDEVLAVGDAAFQKKCLARMSTAAGEGRTVILVSHNMDAIQRLCTECILLDNGRIADMGEASRVITAYLLSSQDQARPESWVDLTTASRSGTGEVRFKTFRYSSEDAALHFLPYPFGRLAIDFRLDSDRARRLDSLAITIRTRGGTLLMTVEMATLGESIQLLEGENLVSVVIDELYLNPGIYTVGFSAGSAIGESFDVVDPAAEIEVIPAPGGNLGTTPGGMIPSRFRVVEHVAEGANPSKHMPRPSEA